MHAPTWDLNSEYTGFESKEFLNDRRDFDNLSRSIVSLIGDIQTLFHKTELNTTEYTNLVSTLQKITELETSARIVVWNMWTYTSCQTSVDGSMEVAKKTQSQINQMITRMDEIMKPVDLFLVRAPENTFKDYLQHSATKAKEFILREQRKKQPYMLSEPEELLLTSLRQPGLHYWSDLYNNLCGTMKCEVEMNGKTETMGLGQTATLLFSSEENKRKAGYQAVHKAWKTHQESAAAILNSLAQYRLVEEKKRSHTKKKDYFTDPLFNNRIERKTLEALMSACEKNAPDIRKALTAMAKHQGKAKLDPWDLLAPAPTPAKDAKDISFADGVHIVRSAFAEVSPEFAEFMDMMVKNNWIEGRSLPNKRQGAYCTGFAKSRTPRVFMTYSGSTKAVMTLAHEVGHAYHSWVMRDMPLAETSYPMTLAETASIFAETTVGEYMEKNSKDKNSTFESAWGDASEAISLLINIPARFEFEKNFYEQRENGYSSATDLSKMTNDAWTKWYGDTLTSNDEMFWASKLHFSMAGLGFYNFPYTFGYLFSLSIYARKEEFGADFSKKYIAILRDTGRMSAEELVRKHLGEDITQIEFWQKAIDVAKQKVQHFISLV